MPGLSIGGAPVPAFMPELNSLCPDGNMGTWPICCACGDINSLWGKFPDMIAAPTGPGKKPLNGPVGGTK
jgi:hypothetical protein